MEQNYLFQDYESFGEVNPLCTRCTYLPNCSQGCMTEDISCGGCFSPVDSEIDCCPSIEASSVGCCSCFDSCSSADCSSCIGGCSSACCGDAFQEMPDAPLSNPMGSFYYGDQSLLLPRNSSALYRCNSSLPIPPMMMMMDNENAFASDESAMFAPSLPNQMVAFPKLVDSEVVFSEQGTKNATPEEETVSGESIDSHSNSNSNSSNNNNNNTYHFINSTTAAPSAAVSFTINPNYSNENEHDPNETETENNKIENESDSNSQNKSSSSSAHETSSPKAQSRKDSSPSRSSRKQRRSPASSEDFDQDSDGDWMLLPDSEIFENPSGRSPPKMWTKDECDRLHTAISRFGVGHWTEISRFVGTRCVSQCINKWKNSLSKKRERWTAAATKQLREYVQSGASEKEIAKLMPQYTYIQLYQQIRKLRTNSSPWAEWEIELLIKLKLEGRLGDTEIGRQLNNRHRDNVKNVWNRIKREQNL